MTFASVLHNPIVRGAVSGALAAAAVDIHAFQGWKDFSEAAQYSWGTAMFRWVTGAVAGAATAAGFGLVS